MDRPIVQTGEIPRSQDVLFGWQQAMVGLAKLSEALIGNATRIAGLSAAPTSPASMSVEVQPGQIYQIEPLESASYGILAADTAHQVLKQGLALDAQQLACPAPTTSGYSINYLIQAGYVDQDGSPEVVPFYNAADPSTAYSGPNNSGNTINTIRSGLCAVNVKAGVAATTGSQATPTPDSGYVGVYVVTVNYGATTITSGDIAVYANAPFIGVPLLSTGSATNYDITSEAYTAYQQGAVYSYVPHTNNTGAATADFGPGALPIKLPNLSDPYAGDLESGVAANLRYDGTNLVLQNPKADGAGFALKNGDSTNVFNVADATTNSEAVNRGQFPSSFSSTSYTWTKTPDASSPTGYRVEQWVKGPVHAGGTGQIQFTVSWPIAFPNVCTVATCATHIDAANSSGDPYYQLIGDPNATSASVYRQISGSGSDTAATWVTIHGIGY